MNIYLHIGSTKTGTTSIQDFMANNFHFFKKCGIKYPRFCGDTNHKVSNHIKLAGYACNPNKENIVRKMLKLYDLDSSIDFINRFRMAFEKNVNLDGYDYVFSSEHCSALLTSEEEIKMLYDLLTCKGHNVKVIFYAREQVSYLLSSYSTQLKNGSTHDILYPNSEQINDKYDYYAILQKWAKVFGNENIVARVFDKDELYQNDVVNDFLSIIDNGQIDVNDLVFEKIKNEALGTKSALFMKYFNNKFPRVIDGKLNKNRGGIAQSIENVAHGSKIKCPSRVADRLRDELCASNKNFRLTFLDGQLSSPFKTSSSSSGIKLLDEEELSKDEVMEMWAIIYNNKYKR